MLSAAKLSLAQGWPKKGLFLGDLGNIVFISGPFVHAHSKLQPPLPHALICTHLGDPPSPQACVRT